MKPFFLTSISLLVHIGTHAQSDVTSADKVWNLTEVDSVPEFPGGTDALTAFMTDNIVTPPNMGDGCGGDRYARVVTRFAVNTDGSINDISVVDSVGPLYNQEAILLIQSLPHFRPGYKDGKVVRVYFDLPVIFGTPRKKTDTGY